MAQQRALVRMRDESILADLVTSTCWMNAQGDDLVQIGEQAPVRLERSGRFHSVGNLLRAYPKIYRSTENEILSHRSNIVYLRKPPVFYGAAVRFMRRLRCHGVKVVLEIPTYPYDRELTPGSLLLRLDQQARRRLRGAVDLIATFSEDRSIFGVPCVNIDNGADLAELPLSQGMRPRCGVRLTCVSALEPWHRVDRVLDALIESWKRGSCPIGVFHVVGEGPMLNELRETAQRAGVAESRVVFHGALYGEALSAVLDETDLAIGSMEEEADRGLKATQALKHREYAARGIPFIYGIGDPVFKDCDYALQVKDGQIDLDSVLEWFWKLDLDRYQIRNDAARFTWDVQFNKVLAALVSP